MAASIAELCDATLRSENVYTSIHSPTTFPQTGNRIYGGYSLAFAVSSAYRFVNDPEYELYSCVGHYLNAGRADKPLNARVENLRKSRTLATCRVSVSQDLDGNDAHPILSIQADFHHKETRSLPPFSATPKYVYSKPDDLPHIKEQYREVVERNGLPPKLATSPFRWFKNYWDHIEMRYCPEGVGSQNLTGWAEPIKTTQDHLPIAEKISADWIRSTRKLGPDGREHAVAVAFALDIAIAFAALTHDHKRMDEVAVCTSLDVSLRFFRSPDMNQWMLRELQSHAGGNGRSYSEYRVFDSDGRMVASCSQQSLLRPKKAKI